MIFFVDFDDNHEIINQLDKIVLDIVAIVVVGGNNMDIEDQQKEYFDIVLKSIVIGDVAVAADDFVVDNKNLNTAIMAELVKFAFEVHKERKMMLML